MNVRKRGLALLMCICMIFTLLPFSAFADATKKASPLNIEYWCTNQPVNVSGHLEETVTFLNGDVKDSYKVYYSDISAQLSDNSLKFLSAIAPASVSTSDTYALKDGSKVDVPFNYIYWKTMVQSGDEVQTGKAGSNATSKGTEIISIQKTDNGYVYYSAANTTTPVQITSDMHIVCYYKQVLAQSDEIGSITGSDWGWPSDAKGEQSQIAKERAAKLKVTYQIKVIDDDSVKASQTAYYNVFTDQTNGGTIKDINVTPAFGYEVVSVDIKHDNVDQKSQDKTINATNGSIPDQTLNRNEGSLTVIYYLKPIENPTLSFRWIGEAPKGKDAPAGRTCTKGEEITKNDIYGEYKIGDKVKTPEYTYTFNGWYKDLATKEIIESGFKINGDTILYGEWTKTANEYTVSYTVNGDVPDGYTAPGSSNVAAGTEVTVAAAPDADDYPGYTFSGWTAPEGVAVGEDGKFAMPAKDVVFTGSWEKIPTYKVTYAWGSLTDEMGSISVPTDVKEYKANDNVTVQAPSDDAMAKAKELGYKFAGWKLGETTYNPNATFGMPQSNVTLVAKWTKLEKYTLSYNWTVQSGRVDNSVIAGSATLPNATTYYEGEVATVDTDYKNPSLGGKAVKGTDGRWYTFSGWYKDAGLSAQADTTIEMNSNITLYGNWVEVYNSYNYTIECYWIGDKEKLLNDPVSAVANVPAGETFTLEEKDYPAIDGYTALENQTASVTIDYDTSNNVIKLYYSRNIIVTANSETHPYNGKLQTVTGYTVKTAADKDGNSDEITLNSIKAHGEGTDASEYPVKLSFDRGMPLRSVQEADGRFIDLEVGMRINGNDYYVSEVNNGTLTITPLTVTITGDSKEVYYNGKVQTFTTDYEVKGLLEGHEIDKEGLTHTLKGKDVGNDYKGKFNKTKDEVEIYDKEAGEYAPVTENYIVNLVPGTLTIKARPVTPPVAKRDLTITAGSKTGIAPVTCDEYTVEGLAAGDVVAYVKITGSQNEPGESANVASDAVIKNAAGVDVTKNYNIKYVDGILKAIEPLNKEDHFNYIIGYTDGTVRPNADITRAEVATIFFRLLTDEAREMYSVTTSSFTDVANGAWYTRAIATLANAGILKGDPDGSFRPDDAITRAEMAAVIARFAKLDVNTKTFSDIDGHWAKDYIELAAGNGWINGYDDGSFRPDNNITRAETVAMINRVLDRQTENVSDLLPADQMTTWSDNMDTTQWFYKDMQEATNNHECERVGSSVYEKWTEKLTDIDWATYQI